MKPEKKEKLPTVYTVQQISKALRTTDNWVREKIKEGRLVAFVFGSGYRIRAEDLDTFLEELRASGPIPYRTPRRGSR